MQNNLFLLLPIVLPIISAVLILVTIKKSQIFAKFISVITVLGMMVLVAQLFFSYTSGQELKFMFDSTFFISIKLDGFRILHLALTCILWLVALVFYFEYSKKTKDKHQGAFLSLMMVTFSAVLGIFMSDDLFTLFIFFEIMSFSSYGWILIGKRKDSRNAANIYLAVSLIGGMIILMGLIVLKDLAFGLNIEALYEYSKSIGASSQMSIAAGLIVIGFGAKAGMYPLHFWLPRAYVGAPAPASALLSAILSKTGVFGIIIVGSNLFMGDYSWHIPMLVLGVITMFWGGICAVINANMKIIIAFSSMSQIGFILVGVAMVGILADHNTIAASGVVLHMLNHSLIKVVLFSICGIFFMNLGGTKLSRIKGSARKNPFIAVAFSISALGLSGMPFFNGYVSKTLLHESIVEKLHLMESGSQYYGLIQASEWIFLISGGLTVAYLLKIASALFAKNPNAKKLDISLATKAVISIPLVIMLAIGIVPNITADSIASFSYGIMHAHELDHAVNYFSWVNLQGALISIGIGILIFFLIVRPFMRKKDTGEYKELYTGKFSLGKLVYTPIFVTIVPMVLGAVCVVLSNLVDKSAEIFSKLVFKPAKEKNLGIRKKPISYRFGKMLDRMHLHVISRFRKDNKTYAEALEEVEKESYQRRRMIQSSLSYGLMFSGVGFIIILLYLLLS